MPDTSRPVVRLWEHAGTGLIISWSSGIAYSNQARGTTCTHPSLEGVFVPVGNALEEEGTLLSPAIALYDYFEGPPHLGSGAPDGLTHADADFIELCLHREPSLRNIGVDRDRLKESVEAWVFVRIAQPSESSPLFEDFGPFPLSGVLTWPNSD